MLFRTQSSDFGIPVDDLGTLSPDHPRSLRIQPIRIVSNTMADSTLGRLLSIRRKRGSRGSRGSLDTDVDNSSFGSDDVTPARGRSISSRKYEPLDTQSRDAGSTHGIAFNVPDEKEGGEAADDTSPLSYELEDPEL